MGKSFKISVFLILAGLSGILSQSAAHAARFAVEARDIRSVDAAESGLVVSEVLIVFHDGTFDLFDPGEQASDVLAAYASGGNPELLIESATSQGFDAVVVPFDVPRLSGPVSAARLDEIGLLPSSSITEIAPDIDLGATPYISYIGKVHPADDLFFANEDPARFFLGGELNESAGPISIDIFGQDLFDAGTRDNDEQNLLLLDVPHAQEPLSEALVRSENDVVQPHLGFLGSQRESSAEPGRVLGDDHEICLDPASSSVGCIGYSPSALDFTAPGYPLLQLLITQEYDLIHGAWSGSYRDASRRGEGFSVDFIGDDLHQVVLYWYTYREDGSGRQMWLVGQGEKTLNESRSSDSRKVYDYPIVFLKTRGGRLTSVENPALVEREVWGEARLTLTRDYVEADEGQVACRQLLLTDIVLVDETVQLELPISPNSGLPEYHLTRVGGLPSGLERFCGDRTSFP